LSGALKIDIKINNQIIVNNKLYQSLTRIVINFSKQFFKHINYYSLGIISKERKNVYVIQNEFIIP